MFDERARIAYSPLWPGTTGATPSGRSRPCESSKLEGALFLLTAQL